MSAPLLVIDTDGNGHVTFTDGEGEVLDTVDTSHLAPENFDECELAARIVADKVFELFNNPYGVGA